MNTPKYLNSPRPPTEPREAGSVQRIVSRLRPWHVGLAALLLVIYWKAQLNVMVNDRTLHKDASAWLFTHGD